MRTLFASMAMLLALAPLALAAPISDGSIYLETFTSYPESPKSQAINAGTSVSGGEVHIVTEVATEGVFRVSPLTLPSEYVVEFDWKTNAPTGDNFYMLYNEGSSAPWSSNIAMRAFPDNANWKFQVDFAGGGFDISDALNYGQYYHITVHTKPGANAPVDLYVDGVLMGTYDSRNPSLATTLLQFGDPSGGSGFGNVSIDNISIGLPIVVPEPGSALYFLTMLGIAILNRRSR